MDWMQIYTIIVGSILLASTFGSISSGETALHRLFILIVILFFMLPYARVLGIF